MKTIQLLLYFLLTIALFSSCKQNNQKNNMTESNQEQDSVYVVDLKARDYAFDMPEEILSGWITFRMENMGEDNHIAMIYRSESELTVEELRSKIDSSNYKFPKTQIGGPGIHSPGQKSNVTLYLDPGNYLVICHEKAENGKSHSELGMQAIFKVAEKSSGATEPKADTRIILDKYEMQRTKTFATGKQTVEIINKDFPYGLHLFRVQDSLSVEKALRKMDGKSGGGQVEWLTGVEPSGSASSTFITYDFSPGEYVWTSYGYVWGVMDHFKIAEGDDTNIGLTVSNNNEPQALTITIENNNINLSGVPQPGANSFHFKNQQDDEHELFLMRIEEGKDKDDIIEILKAHKEDHLQGHHDHEPMPVKGEAAVLDKKSSYEVVVDLYPGKYAIVCFGEEGEEFHYELGGTAEFVVN